MAPTEREDMAVRENNQDSMINWEAQVAFRGFEPGSRGGGGWGGAVGTAVSLTETEVRRQS